MLSREVGVSMAGVDNGGWISPGITADSGQGAN